MNTDFIDTGSEYKDSPEEEEDDSDHDDKMSEDREDSQQEVTQLEEETQKFLKESLQNRQISYNSLLQKQQQM